MRELFAERQSRAFSRIQLYSNLACCPLHYRHAANFASNEAATVQSLVCILTFKHSVFQITALLLQLHLASNVFANLYQSVIFDNTASVQG